MIMRITNTKTKLSKIVDMDNDLYPTHDLASIYKFYDKHKSFSVDIEYTKLNIKC